MNSLQNYKSPKPMKLLYKQTMPSPLIKSPCTPRYVPKQNSVDDLDRKFVPEDDADEMVGKAGLVYYAISNPGQRKVAIKRQCIDDPLNKESIGYRELKIMKHLNNIEGSHNFISLIDWNKCWLAQSPKKNKSKEKQNVQCINMVMEQAGRPLHDFIGKNKTMSLFLFRQSLFQVLFSLMQAQKTCEFMHNDLHLRNILLDQITIGELAPGTNQWKRYKTNDENVWWVDICSRITIVDFGLSRISLPDGTVIHNNVHKIFLPGSDVEQLALEFRKFKISSWTDDRFPDDNNEAKNKKLKRDLLTKMKKGLAPSLLVAHEFFSCMRNYPLDATTTTDVTNTTNATTSQVVEEYDDLAVTLPVPTFSPVRPRIVPLSPMKKSARSRLPSPYIKTENFRLVLSPISSPFGDKNSTPLRASRLSHIERTKENVKQLLRKIPISSELAVPPAKEKKLVEKKRIIDNNSVTIEDKENQPPAQVTYRRSARKTLLVKRPLQALAARLQPANKRVKKEE